MCGVSRIVFRMKYTLKKSTLTKLRAKLTRAINSGEAKKVLSTVEEAYGIFDKEGYPDDWSRWERAKEDFRPYKSDPYWVYDKPAMDQLLNSIGWKD